MEFTLQRLQGSITRMQEVICATGVTLTDAQFLALVRVILDAYNEGVTDGATPLREKLPQQPTSWLI